LIWRSYIEPILLNQEKHVADSNEARELSDRVTRKLVEVAREGVIDLETLRERTLAEIASSRAKIALAPPTRMLKKMPQWRITQLIRRAKALSFPAQVCGSRASLSC
jgi:hypothetical protein